MHKLTPEEKTVVENVLKKLLELNGHKEDVYIKSIYEKARKKEIPHIAHGLLDKLQDQVVLHYGKETYSAAFAAIDTLWAYVEPTPADMSVVDLSREQYEVVKKLKPVYPKNTFLLSKELKLVRCFQRKGVGVKTGLSKAEMCKVWELVDKIKTTHPEVVQTVYKRKEGIEKLMEYIKTTKPIKDEGVHAEKTPHTENHPMPSPAVPQQPAIKQQIGTGGGSLPPQPLGAPRGMAAGTPAAIATATPQTPKTPKQVKVVVVDSTAGLAAVEKEVAGEPVIVVDIGVAGNAEPGRFHGDMRYLAIGTDQKVFIIDLVKTSNIALVKQIILRRGVIGHDLKHGFHYCYKKYGFIAPHMFDVMVNAQLLEKGFHDTYYRLEDIVLKWLSIKMMVLSAKDITSADIKSNVPLQVKISERCSVVKMVYTVLKDHINTAAYNTSLSESVSKEYVSVFGVHNPVSVIENSFIRTAIGVEMYGIGVNTSWLQSHIAELNRLMKHDVDFLKKIVKAPIKGDGELTLEEECAVLTELGFCKPAGDKNTGKTSGTGNDVALPTHVVNAKDSEIEAINTPVSKALISLRRKKRNRDFGVRVEKRCCNGRVLPELVQIRTPQGRLAITNPDLENVPQDGSWGPLFYPSPGNVFVYADYSQLHFRIICAITGEPVMRCEFEQKVDLHKEMAKLIKGSPNVSDEERQRAKAVNYKILYGMSGESLVKAVKETHNIVLTLPEANRYIQQFYSKYQHIKKYRDDAVLTYRSSAKVYLKSLYGRDMCAEKFTQGLCYPVLGTEPDMLKAACVFIRQDLFKNKIKARVCLTVRDEIIIEGQKDAGERIACILQSAMWKAAHLVGIPMAVDDIKTVVSDQVT